MPHAVRGETWIVSYKDILEMKERVNKAQYAICLSPMNGLGSFGVFGCPVSVCGKSDLCSRDPDILPFLC